MAGAAITCFKIDDRDEAHEFLLEGLTYIYPIDPFVSPPTFTASFTTYSRSRRGPSETTSHTVTRPSRTSFATHSSTLQRSTFATYDGLFRSSLTGSDEREVPIPMVALAATAVSECVLTSATYLISDRFMPLLKTGVSPEAPFQPMLDDVYRRHVVTLENIKKANLRVFHAMTASIHRRCMYVSAHDTPMFRN